MVAMISIIQADDLTGHADLFIASLSRFTEEGPVAAVLKSYVNGTWHHHLS